MKRIDHIIIRTDNLHQGIKEFQEAGFQVYYGRKPEKAYNALIYLQDDSFIELVDVTRIPLVFRELTRLGIIRLLHPFYDRIGNFAFKDGPILDYVIYTPNIHTSYERVKRDSSKVIHGKREKPNGTVVRWYCFAPKNNHWPFIISDYVPERMSDDETNIHPNGITGLQNIMVSCVADVATLTAQMVKYYQLDQDDVRVHGSCFSIQTENSKITYVPSNEDKISQVTLRPHSPMVDERLKHYGISTTDEG